MITAASYKLHTMSNQGWDERIRVFQCDRLVTSFAVISRRYVVLLDTLHSPRHALIMLDAVRDELRAGRQLLVINTHADWDHAWGNAAFAGESPGHVAPVIGHTLCRERLLSDEARASLEQKRAEEPQVFAETTLVPPTLTFTGQLTIDGGDLSFELLPTPGHTPDHISVFIPEIQTVFPGDAAERPLPFVGGPDDVPMLRASLRRLLALEATTAFYCHAPGIYNPQVIQDNIAYFDEVEQCVVTALTADRVPGQIDDTTDVEALIDFPFDSVPHVAELDDKDRAFYRAGHQQAIRAMIAHLQAQPTI
jgi:glyoxylase-like metal-dependent hydrolase (beta-lactamase superfamily II)